VLCLLGSGDDGFPDDADPRVRHRLPVGLVPALGPDGTPQALLARTPEGGFLQLRLDAVWPALGEHDRRVAPSAGRLRLRWHTPTAAPQGGWHDAVVSGQALVDRALALEPAELAIARRLVLGGAELLEIEVELVVEGRLPRLPWLARVAGPSLQSLVLAQLGEGPHAWASVEDAFAGLSLDAFTWLPLEPAALPPPPDEALQAIARHAAPLLLVRDDDRYVAAPSVPAQLDLDLGVARAGSRRVALRWSFSEFLAAQPDPSKHLVTIDGPAPLEAAVVQLVNDVPLAAAGIRSIEVEIMTGGPSGRRSHRFEPGQPSAARLTVIREGHDPLALTWRARAIVMVGGRPTQVDTDPRPSGQSIRVDADALGLRPLRFAADAAVFEHAEAIEVALPHAQVQLTAAAPEAWAVGRTPPAAVEVAVALAEGPRVALGTLPLGPRGLVIGVAELGVGAAATVRLRPPADLEARAAYLAVQVEGGPWRTLEAGGALAWSVRLPTRVHAPRLRYRTRHVPRRADGSTAPIVESPWRKAEGAAVEVEV
jgi:hypothetical protein